MSEPLEIRTAIARLVNGQGLDAGEMALVVGQIMDGGATAAQIGALLVGLRIKGETVDEVVGAATAMRSRMLTVPFQAPVILDTCGTGGDGSGSVNVSTLASFIIAGCGVVVAKHGNRALSSRSGSSDALEAMGVDPAPSPELAALSLREAGLAFLFAPTFHAATRHAAGPRRELGMKTVFNLIGPLTNPGGARHHVNGVYSIEACRLVAQAHHRLGAVRAMVIHGAGGMDEITPAGPTHVAELNDGRIREYDIRPSDFGLEEHDPSGLKGGEPELNARILLDTLSAKGPAAVRTAAILAAAAGLFTAGAATDLRGAARLATSSLDDGRALRMLQRMRELTPAGRR